MTLTPAMRAQLQALDDGDGLLLLVRMDDPILSAPIRVVNDSRDWTIGGETFVALPLEITLPTDTAGQAARAQIEMSNVGRDLTAELEHLPLGSSLELTLQIVSRARPEQIEWEYTAPISRITATVPRIVVVLSDDAQSRQSAVLLRYDRLRATGLFSG